MIVRWGMLSAAAIGRVVAAAIRDLPDAERLLADPTGKLHLAPGPDSTDAYRLEFAAASHAIESGDEPLFGRADAIVQAATVEAVREAARTGARVTPAR